MRGALLGYVARDKYFSWEGTIDALTALCPSSSLTIISRWRDRGFGEAGRLLRRAVQKLSERGGLSGLDTLPCIGFDCGWNQVDMLEVSLPEITSNNLRAKVVSETYRYMLHTSQSHGSWEKLKSITNDLSISFPEIDDVMKRAVREVEVSASRDQSLSASQPQNPDDAKN